MNASSPRRYLWLVGLLAFIGFAADQASKYTVFARLFPGDHPHEVIPGYFELRVGYTNADDPGGPLSFLRTISAAKLPHVNKGALFGWGNDESGGWNVFFALISAAAAVFIVYWARRPNVACDRFLCFALGLILAGALGNLYDRIVFSGVRDFLHFYINYDGQLRNWPDFNIADCCLVCGAGALLVHSFFVSEKTPQTAQAESVQQPAPFQTTTPAGGV